MVATKVFTYEMLYLGIALMGFNLVRYVQFSKNIRKKGNWQQERYLLNIPLVLMVFFLLGDLAVAFFTQPDAIVSGVLFASSVFAGLSRTSRRMIS